MFQSINRNNRLFMAGNFLFALSYGLWMNLRQLHLGDLGATPADIGAVLGVVSIAGGLLPVPAGLLADRVGPKRVILASWVLAALGTLIAALAPDWPTAGLGFATFMLVIAANPATVAFVLLNASRLDREGEAERVMATVFASWPAAMVFAPLLGGLIGDRLGIRADLWLGAAGFLVAALIFSRAGDTRPAPAQRGASIGAVLGNRRFRTLAACYALVLVAMYVGYSLAPTYLQDARGYSVGEIGALYSVLSVGSLGFNVVVGKARPRVSVAILAGAVWLGTLLVWRTSGLATTALAFLLLGGISTVWLLAQTSFGRLVRPEQRGLALGLTESLAYVAIAAASWLAGQLYGRTPAHDLPLMLGLVAMLPAFGLWLVLPIGRAAEAPASRAPAPALARESQ